MSALTHWPDLVFLDLSDTPTARDPHVLSGLEHMKSLQVLKLKHIGLRDIDCDTLAEATKIRIRSLDVRDNLLTDASVRTLLAKCFHRTRDVQTVQKRAHEGHADQEDWLKGIPRPTPDVLDQFRGDDIDQRFIKLLTQSVVGRIPTEDLPPTGITHLYIANNYITMEGIASLVKTQNLHVLDAGDLDTAKVLGRPRTLSSLSSPVAQSFLVPGAEKLTGILEKFATENLTYLRLHHTVLTSPMTTKEVDLAELDSEEGNSSQQPQLPELDGEEAPRPELQGDLDHPAELDAMPPVYELPDNDATPRYELVGDPIQIVVSPAANKTTFPRDLSPPPSLGSPASAPEVVSEAEDNLILTPTGLSPMVQAASGREASGIDTPAISNLSLDNGAIFTDDPSSRLSQINSRRHELRYGIRDANRGLLPGRLPHLQTLTLTEVSTMTPSKTLIQNLKSFISDCAIEHHLAVSQADIEAKADPHRINYPNPHSHSRPSGTSAGASSFFALQKIILELTPPRSRDASRATDSSTRDHPSLHSPHHSPHSPQFPPSAVKRSKNWSTTEDPDTEAFWNAAENDFSFFSEGVPNRGDGDECGLPAVEPGGRLPKTIGDKEAVVVSAAGDNDDESVRPGSRDGRKDGGSRAEVRQEREQLYDVVGELARWRAERKGAFREAMEEEGGGGGKAVFVEGYWPGEVKIVRLGRNRERDADGYGGCFERVVRR